MTAIDVGSTASAGIDASRLTTIPSASSARPANVIGLPPRARTLSSRRAAMQQSNGPVDPPHGNQLRSRHWRKAMARHTWLKLKVALLLLFLLPAPARTAPVDS